MAPIPLLALAVVLLSLCACGNEFTDCAAYGTCADAKESDAGESFANHSAGAGGSGMGDSAGTSGVEDVAGHGGNDPSVDATAGQGGDDTPQGVNQAGSEAGSTGEGSGGASFTAECLLDEDCDDRDASNGAERCVDDACESGNSSPRVVSMTPLGTEVDPEAEFSIRFSEALAPTSVNETSVTLERGTESVPATVSLSGDTIVVKPRQRLHLLAEYTLSVDSAIQDLEGATLLEPHEENFSVRDGAFAEPVELGTRLTKAERPALTIDASGATHVVFQQCENEACEDVEIVARHAKRPESFDVSVPLVSGFDPYEDFRAAFNQAGDAVVAWNHTTSAAHVRLRQYRAGAWLPVAAVPGSGVHPWQPFNVAISPIGDVHVSSISDAGDQYVARRSSPGGAFGGTAHAFDPWPDYYARAYAAFDAAGNGFISWRTDRAGVHTARYAASSGAYGDNVLLEGSLDAVSTAPTLVLEPGGDGMLLFLDQSNALVSSRFTRAGGWSALQRLRGPDALSPPNLVFDGEDFVAVWNALPGGTSIVNTYTARYANDGWSEPSLLSDGALSAAGPLTTGSEKPGLGADEDGNLLAVWLVAEGDSRVGFRFARYERSTGTWSTPLSPFSVAVNVDTDDIHRFASDDPFAFDVGENGTGAVAWTDRNGSARLAFFR